MLLFLYVCEQLFHISRVHIFSKSKRCYNAKRSAHYFYVKGLTLSDFHICISIPLREKNAKDGSLGIANFV